MRMAALSARAPLLYAALKDYAGTAKVLLQHGADPNIADNSGGTTLPFAASSGSRKVVKLLLAHGAKINVKDVEGKTPLDVATVETADILRHNRGKHGKSSKNLPPGSLPWKGRAPYN
jgi:ankyrin repeat protein